MEFWHKKPFSIGFVIQIQNHFQFFEPTVDYIMLHNFGTVRPILPINCAKSCARLAKKKVMKARGAENIFPRNYRAKRRGGGYPPPPPPRPFSGLRGNLFPEVAFKFVQYGIFAFYDECIVNSRKQFT